jgi:hypothetical protein
MKLDHQTDHALMTHIAALGVVFCALAFMVGFFAFVRKSKYWYIIIIGDLTTNLSARLTFCLFSFA